MSRPEKRPVPGRRFAYRYRLRDNRGGGVYLTDEPSLTEARYSLLAIYGNALDLVVRATGTADSKDDYLSAYGRFIRGTHPGDEKGD